MKIKATCYTIEKHSMVSREFLRKAMITWGWNQGEADGYLIALELGKSITIDTPKGMLLLEPIEEPPRRVPPRQTTKPNQNQ